MKKCQFCRESIDEDAIVCKYCKNKQRVLPPMTIDEKKHLIKSTLIILGVLVIYFILYFSNRGVFWDGLKKHHFYMLFINNKCYMV